MFQKMDGEGRRRSLKMGMGKKRRPPTTFNRIGGVSKLKKRRGDIERGAKRSRAVNER